MFSFWNDLDKFSLWFLTIFTIHPSRSPHEKQETPKYSISIFKMPSLLCLWKCCSVLGHKMAPASDPCFDIGRREYVSNSEVHVPLKTGLEDLHDLIAQTSTCLSMHDAVITGQQSAWLRVIICIAQGDSFLSRTAETLAFPWAVFGYGSMLVSLLCAAGCQTESVAWKSKSTNTDCVLLKALPLF